MTLEEAEARVQEIRDVKGDPEMAHFIEDNLMMDFVRHVRDHGPARLSKVARVIASTDDIDFPRWCA